MTSPSFSSEPSPPPPLTQKVNGLTLFQGLMGGGQTIAMIRDLLSASKKPLSVIIANAHEHQILTNQLQHALPEATVSIRSVEQWVSQWTRLMLGNSAHTVITKTEALATLLHCARHVQQQLPVEHDAYFLYNSASALNDQYTQWQHQLLHEVAQPDLDDRHWFFPVHQQFLAHLEQHQQTTRGQQAHPLLALLTNETLQHPLSDKTVPNECIHHLETMAPVHQHLIQALSQHLPINASYSQNPRLPLLELPYCQQLINSHVPLSIVSTALNHLYTSSPSDPTPSPLSTWVSTPDELINQCVTWALNATPPTEHTDERHSNSKTIVIPQQAEQQPHLTVPQTVLNERFITDLRNSLDPHGVQLIDATQTLRAKDWPALGVLQAMMTNALNNNTNNTNDTDSTASPLLDNFSSDTLTALTESFYTLPDGFASWAWRVLHAHPDIRESFQNHPAMLKALSSGLQGLNSIPTSTLHNLLQQKPDVLYDLWPEHATLHSTSSTLPNTITITYPHQTLVYPTDHLLILDGDTIANHDQTEQGPHRWDDILHHPQLSLCIIRLQTDETNPSPILTDWANRISAQQTQAAERHQHPLNSELEFTSELTTKREATFDRPLTPPSSKQGLPVIPESATLSISATGLNNYMRCPRQYFYSQILQLRGEPNDKAQTGILIHRLLEALNQQFPKLAYTAESLHQLFTDYLNPHHPTFNEADRALFFERSAVEQADLRHRVIETIDDLNQSGYFAQPLTHTLGEQRFRFTHPDIERTQFQGSIDAILGQPLGTHTSWDIVDYKHDNPTKWRTAENTRIKHLATALNPIPEDKTNHADRFSDNDKRNYQMVLYYLATLYDAKLLKTLATESAQSDESTTSSENTPPPPSVQSVGLQVVRPPIGGADSGAIGSCRIALLADELKAAESAVVQDLNTYILGPIRTTQHFETVSGRHCSYCGHRYTCNDPAALN